MSRQQAKSRGDKGGGRGGGAQSVAVPSVTTDIIPGRVTVADWNKICSTDEDDEFVGSIVEEILEKTLENYYDHYISKQVIPFTVHRAKEDLLQIIEWRFLSHDIGEENIQVNRTWKEDTEPDPGIIDSWAQGSVPIIVKKQPVPEVPTIVEAKSIKDEEELSLDDATETISLATGLGSQTTEEVKVQTPIKPEKPKAPENKSVKKRVKYKKYTGRLPSAHIGQMAQTIEQSESQLMARDISALEINKSPSSHLPLSQKSFLKLQAGRPPGNKEVTFDERGNVIAVMKLDTKSFPSHRVKVGYQIVDPEAEAAAQRLEAMRTGKLRRLAQMDWQPNVRKTRLSPRRYMEDSTKQTKPKPAYPLPPLNVRNAPVRYRQGGHRATGNAVHIRKHPQRRVDVETFAEPLPPSLIDSIDASPGVVITEGDQVKVGSQSKSLSSQEQRLVTSEDGSIIGNVSVAMSKSLRLLGAGPASSISTDDACFKPTLSPSQVIVGSPTVTSPFSTSPHVRAAHVLSPS